MEAIESFAGIVSSMLRFPLADFLGRLFPAAGSDARQQVATAFGAGLDNLGSLCSQAGLDRWELLGLAVLSAITVYRKELSSNSVYTGKGTGGGTGGGGGGADGGAGSGGGRRYHQTNGGGNAVVTHVDGCHVAVAAAAAARASEGGGGGSEAAAAATGKPCMCARIAALQRQRVLAARRLRAAEDERKLKRAAAIGRIQPLNLNLPVNHHLQQLRASVDASWSSFSSAWEARRARSDGSSSGGSGGGGGGSGREGRAAEGNGDVDDDRERANTAPLPEFGMPPCSHYAPRSSPGSPPPSKSSGAGAGVHEQQQRQQQQRGNRGRSSAGRNGEGGGFTKVEECAECAAIEAAHLAAGHLPSGGGLPLLPGEKEAAADLWAGSPLGVLPTDALHRVVTFLPPRGLLELAQVSKGAREAADSQLAWREVWWARFGVVWESEVCRKAARRWHLHDWDPKSSAVTQGWKEFFFEFETAWLEWIAAGQNLEWSCLVGVHGRLYDITEFMYRHPGSPETLMDNAGADASEMFEDVGHSLDARVLMKSLESLAPEAMPRPRPATASGGGSTSYSPSSQAGDGGGGDPRVGACLLSSTMKRIREERALARREAKAVHLAAAAAGATMRAGGAPATTLASAAELPAGVQEFVCEECEGSFEPTSLDGDGEAGRHRRLWCSAHGHVNGDLRVFYSPVRREWGGFYSCCRQHVCFCLPTAVGP